MKHRLATLGVMLAWFASVAEAQRQNDSASLRHTLLTYRDGSSMRLRTADGAFHRTSSYVVVGTHIVVRDSVRTPMDSVTQVWRRHHHAGTGALIGGIGGAVLLGAAGLMYGSLGCGVPPCRKQQYEYAGIGLATGAPSGAMLGTLFGSFVPNWKLVWQRQP